LAERENIAAQLAGITCPAIVFHGDADMSISLDAAEILCDGLVGCEELVVVGGGPHASNLTHPNEVNGPPTSSVVA
jgi:3-oxoadipate enol-lactonase